MARRIVTVNDRMQKGYRYELVAPVGRGFDPEFRPELTPKEMLRLGVFGGKYMTDCAAEFPASWFKGAKLATDARDCSLNYFGVDASQRLVDWRRKGWIHPDDPRGWFQWYCRYYMGRRMDGEDSGRSGAGKRSAGISGRSRRIASRATPVPPAPAPGAAAVGLRQPEDLELCLLQIPNPCHSVAPRPEWHEF